MPRYQNREIDVGLGVGGYTYLPTAQNLLFSPIGPGIAVSNQFQPLSGSPKAYVTQVSTPVGAAGVPVGQFGTGALLTDDEYRDVIAGGG